MKTTNRYKIRPGKIHSLADIRAEKIRLRLEILKTEEDIHDGYREILSALSPKNIATSMINDVATSSNVLTKAFFVGKSLFSGRKKKKKNKDKTASDQLQP